VGGGAGGGGEMGGGYCLKNLLFNWIKSIISKTHLTGTSTEVIWKTTKNGRIRGYGAKLSHRGDYG